MLLFALHQGNAIIISSIRVVQSIFWHEFAVKARNIFDPFKLNRLEKMTLSLAKFANNRLFHGTICKPRNSFQVVHLENSNDGNAFLSKGTTFLSEVSTFVPPLFDTAPLSSSLGLSNHSYLFHPVGYTVLFLLDSNQYGAKYQWYNTTRYTV